MSRDMTDLPVIRPATIEATLAMAQVHVDTWRTSYVGIVPAEHLANLSYERSQAGWNEHILNQHGREYIFVAEERPGKIIGITSGGPLREAMAGFDGELYVLYVLKSFQGMGYGKRLVTCVAQALISAGYRSMIIWVLKDNPACRFYERLGGRPVAEKVVEIGGKPLIDLAYAWSDIRGFSEIAY